jgi:uncharacterized protein (DUF58 family)
MPARQLVHGEDRNAIAQLQIFARNTVDGITSGRHRSTHKGANVVFKEHRQYARGDEIRSIDWKLFGKTDRLFIRQYEDETNLRAMLLLDQSGSMKYQGTRASGHSKHSYSVRLTACLATLLISQQDAVGLSLFDSHIRTFLPARGQPGYLRTIFQTLVASQPAETQLTGHRPAGEASLAPLIREIAGRSGKRGLIMLISDCFDDPQALGQALSLFRRQGHEVIVFQVWDPDELDFPFRNRAQFRSLESDRQRVVDPRGLQQAYLERVALFRQQLATEFARHRIEHVSCLTSEHCGAVLAEFLASRQRTPRRSASAALPLQTRAR